MTRTLVVGAGPAGLTAAYELARLGIQAIVYEQDHVVGGISRTAAYRDYRFDIGGHRFFTKISIIQDLWEEVLGEDLLSRPRLSRIHYDDKFFDYPLKPLNALMGLGPIEAVRIGMSYLGAQVLPHSQERNFEEWVSNRFGRRLYEIFFKTYTEKVWGIPCTEISAEWAAQRIKNLDLVKALRHALLGSGTGKKGVVTTLIDQFWYPRLGPGMMWQRMTERLAALGVPTVLGARVYRLRQADGHIESALIEHHGDEIRQEEVRADHFISSMPLGQLVQALEPAAPQDVLDAASSLKYRDFLTVVLILDRAEVFPDNWIYIHSPKVKVGRIQNFKNWSPEMVPDASKTSLGLEYFVHLGDELWNATDEELIELGKRELEILGLATAAEVEDGTVVRMPKAYPVYAGNYQESIALLRGYLAGIRNLESIGRNGQHRYNNQDHSMLTGIFAARNVAGESLPVWQVNVDPDYHEEERAAGRTTWDRLTPEKVAGVDIEQLLQELFARYDPIALGVAVGAVGGMGLFLATALLLVQGGEPLGPTLSLLGNYLFGFQVSWSGALVGTAEAALGGFLLGSTTAHLMNGLTAWYEKGLRRRIQMARMLDPLSADTS